jgi:hypothetical protein
MLGWYDEVVPIRAWFAWWRRSRPRAEHLEVVLYTRQGCHLCEVAWARLRTAQERWKFRLTAVDVDRDTGLLASYGECVPVVCVDGVVRFRGVVNEVLLTRLLAAEARRGH